MDRAPGIATGAGNKPALETLRGEAQTRMRVSVVIPVYNERAFIEEVLLRVQASPVEKEILVIDDWSTDGTRQLLEDFDKAQSAEKRERSCTTARLAFRSK